MGSISVVPMILKHRIDKSGKSQIVIRVYQNSKVVCNDKTGKKIEPHFWDEAKRKVKSFAPNSSMLNFIIYQKVSELEKKFIESEVTGMILTKNRLKKIVRGEDPGRDFIKYCEDRIPERYPKKDQKETRRSYFGELKKLQKFQKEICFGDIDPHFLSRYKAWMINVKRNSDNTIWKAFKFMNTMIRDAMKVGVIKNNPFQEFDRGQYKQGKRDYLEISECDKIESLLGKEIPYMLKVIANYYLFMCYTGFRFQDAIERFNPEEHLINNERIIIDTQKFDVNVNILIHSRLRTVLEVVKKNHLSISNKEFNKYLKIIASMAELNVNLTAHVGRHTFGATLAELDVPIEKAQKLLGHRDKRSTEVYYHIKNKSLDKEMQKWETLN
ncbi:MAG TPA: site-specific integrase [Hanamia sp.]|nr:site-specific integrase [Hanamia sp.]